jgi:DNA-binding SARP family transcriptional activator
VVPVGGSVVGAGVVSILDRMRRAQQRHREQGGLIKLPDRSGTDIERRLRSGDGVQITTALDSALRLADQLWHDAPGDIPVVTGARILDETIELVVDGLDPNLRLPPYLSRGDDGDSVVFDRAAADRWTASSRTSRHRRSPAPLLVTVGRGPADTVMVNLESLGSMVIEGDPVECDAVIRSLALESATSHWADQFDLVVVGFGSELERFVRVTRAMDPVALVHSLCRRRLLAHQELAASGYRSFAEARGATGAERWDPLLVICGPSLDPSEAAEVVDAAADPEVGMAVVAVGPDAQGSHRLSLTGNHRSSIELLGSVVFPQMISAEDGAGVHGLLDAAEARGSVGYSAEPYVHLSVRPTPPPDPDAGQVTVRVLGTVEIVGAARPFTRAWAQELVVYLAMHPNGASNEAWATALWPDRLMAPSSLHSTASVARRALGTTPEGIDHLPRSHGRLALSPSVVTDWQRFTHLAESEAVEDRRAALNLVRGRPFDGLRSSDWPILEGIGPAIEAAIVDVSGRLAGACLAAGDPSGAEWAARRGLMASPYDERLYRMLMRAADLAGNPAGVESVMSELVRLVADDVEPFDSVHPSTIDLYRSLTRRRPGSRPRHT